MINKQHVCFAYISFIFLNSLSSYMCLLTKIFVVQKFRNCGSTTIMVIKVGNIHTQNKQTKVANLKSNKFHE